MMHPGIEIAAAPTTTPAGRPAEAERGYRTNLRQQSRDTEVAPHLSV
jgi:hypothetical protein